MDTKTLLSWAYESMSASRVWRQESWRDWEMFDGGRSQWTDKDYKKAIDLGIDPITINRTFPVLNMIQGQEVLNQFDITAKGRTQDDSDIGQTMTELIGFVGDQNQMDFQISDAFGDTTTAGLGWIYNGRNNDPRKEKLLVAHRKWTEMFYDPFSGPRISPKRTRYVFHSPWVDLDNLTAMFPKKKKELEAEMSQLRNETTQPEDDEATLVEWERRLWGLDWESKSRQRVRPIEMWFPEWEKGEFVEFADGRVIDVTKFEPNEYYQAVKEGQTLYKATVQNMKFCTFLGNVKLQEKDTPHNHQEYPFIPFICYIDRWGYPYGIPRQIRGQDEEVNKRRSTALRLLNARRVVTEENVVGKNDYQKLYEEANKPDGMIVTKPGRMDRIRIEEHQELAAGQMSILEHSEKEITEMVGNIENFGYEGQAISGKAIEQRRQAANVMLAPVFNWYRRAKQQLGEQLVANIQGTYTKEKVLRITDRMTGAERFVTINQKITENGQIVVKNNITQGKFDTVVAEAPKTDTAREKYMELVIEWVKKSPPEAIPHLTLLAMEMSDLPNKDRLLMRLRPLFGQTPGDEDMSPEEMKAKVLKELEEQKKVMAKANQDKQDLIDLEKELQRKEIEKLDAEIREIAEGIKTDKAKVVNDRENNIRLVRSKEKENDTSQSQNG